MRQKMLTLDSNQVSRISLQRFARVVEDELAKSKSETAPSNSLAWGNIGTTLAHNLTSTGEDSENTGILSKLRSQVTDVDRVRQSSQHANEAKTAEKPAMGHKTEEVTTTKAATKVSKKERQVADASENLTAADTASGERIQHLLQDQKDLSAKDLEVEQRTQAMLVNELTELTSMLKDSTIGINRAVKLQNIQLASMGVHAAENWDELEKQKQRMKESTQGMTSSLWGTVWTMLWVVAVFSATYAVIRLLPNRKVYPTCSNPNSMDAYPVEAYRAAAGVDHALNTASIVAQDAVPELASPSASSDYIAEQAFKAPVPSKEVEEELVEDSPEPPQEQWEVLPDGEPVAQEPHQLQEDELVQEETSQLEEDVDTEHEPQPQETDGVVDERSVHADHDPTEAEGGFTEDITPENVEEDHSVREDAEEAAVEQQEGQEHKYETQESEGTAQFESHTEEEVAAAVIEEETDVEVGADRYHATAGDTLSELAVENSFHSQVEEGFFPEQPVYKEDLHHDHVAEEDTARQQEQEQEQEDQLQESLQDELRNDLAQAVKPAALTHEGLGPVYDKVEVDAARDVNLDKEPHQHDDLSIPHEESAQGLHWDDGLEPLGNQEDEVGRADFQESERESHNDEL